MKSGKWHCPKCGVVEVYGTSVELVESHTDMVDPTTPFDEVGDYGWKCGYSETKELVVRCGKCSDVLDPANDYRVGD